MSSLFSGNPYSEDRQIFFVSHLRTMAACFYDDENDYQPFSINGLSWQTVQNNSLPGVNTNVAPEIGTWLLSQGVVEFAEFKEGGSAALFAGKAHRGKMCIIRVPTRFDNPVAHKRSDHPSALHPLAGGTFPYGENRNIEILPFVTFAELGDPLFQQGLPILNNVYQLANVQRGDIKNDLAILPDGTLLFGDPDQVKSAQPYTMDIQRKILNKYPYLETILWFKDGKSKQDLFFGGNYLSTPLPPKQRFPEDTPEAPTVR